MGTNFYTLNGRHIGKRSAAGIYCWDCNISLNNKGATYVHDKDVEWYEVCPICGKKVELNGWDNATGKELGFSKIKGKQTGVTTCCSFTWAILPKKCKKLKGIKDEYGRKYTYEEFQEELEFCPIQFYHLIGKSFS